MWYNRRRWVKNHKQSNKVKGEKEMENTNFLSWIEYDGKNYFLTKDDLETERGIRLLKTYDYSSSKESIRYLLIIEYYNDGNKKLQNGAFHKCVDFTDPSRFPTEIVQTLKDGLFEGFGTPIETLIPKLREVYTAVEKAAYDTMQQIKQKANKETDREFDLYLQHKKNYTDEKISLWFRREVEHKKVKIKATKEYQKTKHTIFWNLFKDPNNRIAAWR